MKLEDLPRFTVRVVLLRSDGDQEIKGIFDRPHLPALPVRKDWGWLYSEEKIFLVDLVGLNQRNGIGLLRYAPFVKERDIEAGEIYTWIDLRWDASLVRKLQEEEHEWTRTEFQPQDAVAFMENGTYGWTPAANGVPTDAEPAGILPGGWDHEHCALCWATIGRGGEPIGYRDEEDDWLCPDCFHRYAETHDLSFMAWDEE